MAKLRKKKNRAGEAQKPSAARKRTAGKWLASRLLLVLVGLALAGCIELVVRALPLENVWRPVDDPFVGFSEVHPLFMPGEVQDGRSMMETAENKLSLFNPQRFPRRKEPGTFRIFTLGGSTTYGRPYADQTSFAGWLRVLLEKSGEEERNYEVINAGGVSYASYRVVKVLEELLDYEPDLFVVYTGHNEFLEARTYENFYSEQGSFTSGLKRMLQGLETYRLLDGFYRKVKGGGRDEGSGAKPRGGATTLTAEVQTLLDRTAGMDLYHRDSTFSRGVFEHFDYNIGRIKQLCIKAGVPVLFLEPVDNLKDFSPFKSEENIRLDMNSRRRFSAVLAEGMGLLSNGLLDRGITRLREAVATDSLYAAGHFYLGRALLEAEDTVEAAERFFYARELDVCPLRAQQPIHEILLRHTSGSDNSDLIRLPLMFAAFSPGGIVGDEMLIDHIHPYPEGHLRIAMEILGWMREEGYVPATFQPSDQEVEIIFRNVTNSLPEEYYQKGLLNLTKVLLWANKYQESLHVLESQWEVMKDVAQARYLVGSIMERMGDTRAALEHLSKALELEKDHLMVLGVLARVYTKLGMADSAMATYDKLMGYYPDNAGILLDYGVMLSFSGENARALQVFEKARRLAPEMAVLGNNIGLIYYLDGHYEQALEAFNHEIEINPADPEAYYNIGTLYARSDSQGQAEKFYLEALSRQPKHAGARLNLGNIYQQQGNNAAAEQQFQLVIAADPTQLGAYINLARLYNQAGRTAEAEAVVKAGLERFPDEQQLIRLIQD
ncbi:MAG: tetratricopeptide repeat protein [Candidatus Glassbacteria bacterium]|nr:tetratricopeptide repeat protein [Candidatus Glassbacteria bacterium]